VSKLSHSIQTDKIDTPARCERGTSAEPTANALGTLDRAAQSDIRLTGSAFFTNAHETAACFPYPGLARGVGPGEPLASSLGYVEKSLIYGGVRFDRKRTAVRAARDVIGSAGDQTWIEFAHQL
jgi:hypothetical protein